MGKRSPVLGYNHNFKHRGLIFHVQTEDSGVDNPHLFTHLFHGGVIISSRRTDYDAASEIDLVKGLMQSQHKAVAKGLSSGSFDDKIDAYLGNRDDLEPRKPGSVGSSKEAAQAADQAKGKARSSKAPSPAQPAQPAQPMQAAPGVVEGMPTDVVRIPPELALEAEQAPAPASSLQEMSGAVTAKDIPRIPDIFANANANAPRSAGVFEDRKAPVADSGFGELRGKMPEIGTQERTLEDVTAAAHAAAAEARELAAQAAAEVAHAQQLQAQAAAATARANELEAAARARSHSDSTAHSGAISLSSTSSSTPAPSARVFTPPPTAHVAPSSKSMEADIPHKRKHLPTAVEIPAYEDNLGDPTVTFSSGGGTPPSAGGGNASLSFNSAESSHADEAVPEPVTGEYSGTYSMKRLPQESTQRVGRRKPTSVRHERVAPTRARTTTSRPSGKAGNPEPGRPRSPVVVSRPAVIIGAPPKMVGKKPRRKARSGAGSVFGKDLISEKSLDEVIMAYLSEDSSEE